MVRICNCGYRNGTTTFNCAISVSIGVELASVLRKRVEICISSWSRMWQHYATAPFDPLKNFTCKLSIEINWLKTFKPQYTASFC